MEHKEFKISSWAVDNRVTVYIITLLIAIMGTVAFLTMPREAFPEVLKIKFIYRQFFLGILLKM